MEKLKKNLRIFSSKLQKFELNWKYLGVRDKIFIFVVSFFCLAFIIRPMILPYLIERHHSTKSYWYTLQTMFFLLFIIRGIQMMLRYSMSFIGMCSRIIIFIIEVPIELLIISIFKVIEILQKIFEKRYITTDRIPVGFLAFSVRKYLFFLSLITKEELYKNWHYGDDNGRFALYDCLFFIGVGLLCLGSYYFRGFIFLI